MSRKRVLLVVLGAYGDCLMATAIAHQIKRDHPGCHLTWAISARYSQVLDNNPDVDSIWSVPSAPGESLTDQVWRRVMADAARRVSVGELDLVVDAQIYPDNTRYFDGTTRSSTLRCYPGPITVPVTPVVKLRESEYDNVRAWAASKGLGGYRHIILFECAPSSGQSVLTQKMGVGIAERIVALHADVVVVVSTHIPFESPHPRVLDASALSFRENAALTHYCTLFVGCSSGITWLLTSDAAKPLPMVLFLSPRAKASGFASVAYDFAYWGLPTDHILESDAEVVATMVAIVGDAIDDFPGARSRHHHAFRPAFWDFLCFFNYRSIRGAATIVSTMRWFVRRNRFTWRDVLRVDRAVRVVASAIADMTRRVVRRYGHRP